MSDLEYIRDTLGIPEILAQLAEECAELAQAALKLRRVMDKKNPTPVPFSEAIENLQEEIADVDSCIIELGKYGQVPNEVARIESKRTRWAQRLQEAAGDTA